MSTLALRPLRRRYFRSPHVLFRWRAGLPFPAGATFSRSSPAWYIGADGLLRQAAANVPRIDWSHGRPALRLEPAGTNAIRNPRGEGAIVGQLGSGGAFGTHWGIANTAGLTWEVVSIGVEDGLPYLDIRCSGTPNTTFAQLRFESLTQVPASQGQTSTFSLYVRRIAGSLPSGASVGVRVQERDSQNVNLEQSQTLIDPDAPRLGLARHAHTRTLTNPSTAYVVGYLLYTGLPTTQSIDITLRVALPQHEQAPVPSSLILPPPGAPAVATRATETVTVPWPHAPQPMTLYVRLVEAGGVLAPGYDRVVEIGSGANRIRVQVEANLDRYQLRYDSGGQTAFRAAAAQPAPGQIVELMVPLSESGARLIQAIDGGAPAQTSLAALTLPSAWGTPTLTIGGGGQFDLLDLIVLRGADWTMDQIREVVGV